MGQLGDVCRALKEVVKKYPNNPDAVIDTFYSAVSSHGWDSEGTIYILESGKGISSEADMILNKFIELENSYK
ncbi:MAG: hypothetical protein ACXVC7_17360 [Bacteroidia bacterium]